MYKMSDESLVRAVAEGDISAFEQLVGRYQSKLLSFVTYMVRDSQAAQDIVQESFISLYKTIDHVDTSRKFSSYLFSIARNTAISYLRSRIRHAPLEEAESVASLDVPEALVTGKEEKERIETALDAIDTKYKKVISLYYFEDLSYEEMSRLLRLPVNTIRTHLRRAKDALRTVLTYETQ